MAIFGYTSIGYHGYLVEVEVDIRHGIPGLDIVGLPDGAIKEAKERIKIALDRAGIPFPKERLLINLAPADVKKEGTGFDLPLALAIYLQSRPELLEKTGRLLALGELSLSGNVKGVRGALAAVSEAKEKGITAVIVPRESLGELSLVSGMTILGASTLDEAAALLEKIGEGTAQTSSLPSAAPIRPQQGDFSAVRGHARLRRALEIAAAGRHNILLFGPPGSGKTLCAQTFPSILPALSEQASLEATRIWGLAGKLESGDQITFPPFRSPHHTASAEGIIGGGKSLRPGEISLASQGVLFLDETPEFKMSLLQALREPTEDHVVTLSRAGSSYSYPADYQLILAANPCPCGNLGRPEAVCTCTTRDIQRYWKKIGGALLDRIDMRVPVAPVSAQELLAPPGESSAQIRERVLTARKVQKERLAGQQAQVNGRIPSGMVGQLCPLSSETQELLSEIVKRLSLSARAMHSTLKVARTIADLRGAESIGKDDILEAAQYRRYGESDIYWKY